MENIAVKLVSEFNKIVMVYEKQFDELSEKENLTKLEIAIIGFLANNPAFNTAKETIINNISPQENFRGLSFYYSLFLGSV